MPEIPTALTVAEVARRYRMGKVKVRALIARGELRAMNVATSLSSKPRWIVLPEALAEFERGRAALPPSPARRKKRTEAIDYFP
jgi:hypothetical protein